MLAGCETAPPAQDYRITVVENPGGPAYAIAPECHGWRGSFNALSNQPAPNYGCAAQRNLAAQVVDPMDIVRGRDPGPDSAEKAAASIQRYLDDRVYGLYDFENLPEAIAPSAAAPAGGTPAAP